MKFVSMVTDDYVPGLLTLMQSLKENSGLKNIEFVIIGLSSIKDKNKILIDNMNISYDYFLASELGKFEFDQSLLSKPNKATNQNKFLIFKLPYKTKLCYLDVDMICLNNISNIKNLNHLSAVPNIGRLHPETVHEHMMFNSGMLIFKPDLELYEQIQDFGLKYNEKLTHYGDQMLFNQFFYKYYPSNVNILGLEWNVPISLKKYHPHLWKYVNDKGIKFLHYTAHNPWEKNKVLKHPTLIRKRYIDYFKEYSLWNYYYRKINCAKDKQ